jgi:UDP-glucose 4-epimerase
MYSFTGRIVVTGGAGFIGSHLVDRLLADSRAQVVVFDDFSRGRLTNLGRAQTESRLQILQGDIRDAAAVADALQGASIVFHLAARASQSASDEEIEDSFTTNVVGTFNVLQAASQHAVRRLLFASSREVYGEPIALPVDESHPLLAVTAYGASKVAGEAYCRAFRRVFGLQTVILRLAAVFGPRDSGRFIPDWWTRAQAGQDLYIPDEKQVVDLVSVDQAVDALVRAAEMDEALPPINVASGTGTRVVDVARLIARLTGRRSQVRLLPKSIARPTPFVADVGRMRQLLRIEPMPDPLSYLPRLLADPIGAVGPSVRYG